MADPQLSSLVVAANAAGNGDRNAAPSALDENKIASIVVASIGAVPVVLVESEVTNKQKEVKVRESRFTI